MHCLFQDIVTVASSMFIMFFMNIIIGFKNSGPKWPDSLKVLSQSWQTVLHSYHDIQPSCGGNPCTDFSFHLGIVPLLGWFSGNWWSIDLGKWEEHLESKNGMDKSSRKWQHQQNWDQKRIVIKRNVTYLHPSISLVVSSMFICCMLSDFGNMTPCVSCRFSMSLQIIGYPFVLEDKKNIWKNKMQCTI